MSWACFSDFFPIEVFFWQTGQKCKKCMKFFPPKKEYNFSLRGNIVSRIKSEKLELNKVIVIKNSCVHGLFYRHHIFWRSQFYVALKITFLEDQSFMIFFKLLSKDITKSCTSWEGVWVIITSTHIVYSYEIICLVEGTRVSASTLYCLIYVK